MSDGPRVSFGREIGVTKAVYITPAERGNRARFRVAGVDRAAAAGESEAVGTDWTAIAHCGAAPKMLRLSVSRT